MVCYFIPLLCPSPGLHQRSHRHGNRVDKTSRMSRSRRRRYYRPTNRYYRLQHQATGTTAPATGPLPTRRLNSLPPRQRPLHAAGTTDWKVPVLPARLRQRYYRPRYRTATEGPLPRSVHSLELDAASSPRHRYYRLRATGTTGRTGIASSAPPRPCAEGRAGTTARRAGTTGRARFHQI